MKDFTYIRKHYGVPAEYGREIEYKGKRGFIVDSMGCYIGVNFHDEKRTKVEPFHPTDGIRYLGKGKPRKLTAGQLRYRRYLESESSLSFFEWIKRQ